MSSSSSEKKKITLTSSDGEAFEVDEAVALESPTIKKMIEDNCAGTGIPVPDATNPNDCTSEYHLKAWDAEFVQLDGDTLLDLVGAAHSLKIKSLGPYGSDMPDYSRHDHGEDTGGDPQDL
ncbi:hypothetical protein FH972_007011 [Carpinus fangiana]|uniref:SKP1 component POZ domain-containing protein n=1 Tax=Carpinus fangiana TaxID=176857 RepID=A0A5N6QWF1_9ROSI|nr:hypothetical protein FH972_007011 [Carpinus fangiana]